MSRQGLRAGDVRIEEQRATTARGTRAPEYNFHSTSIRDSTLLPLAFMPVLAGDTVYKAAASARIIAAAPANNTVLGSWFEYWLFNVRIGDMPSAEAIRDVLIDPAGASTIDWRTECMDAIWNVYFRDESESLTWSETSYLRTPRVGWWDSGRDKDELPDTSGAADDWEADWIRYQALRRAKLTTKTWEEYLGAQGVNVPIALRAEHDPELKVPELLVYSREFVYPQMSMAPSSGGSITPTATLQWMINQGLKRSRFCAEPGFLVACAAMRPKRYVIGYNSAGSTVSGACFDPLTYLNDAIGWQPIDLDTDPHTSLVAVPGGYFGDTEEGSEFIMDTRDLFLYGHDEWIQNNVRNDVAADLQLVRMDPKTGSRPVANLTTFAIDARIKLGVKSRLSKDTTR